MQRTYMIVDQKSFYATVECVERGLDPMVTDLVVADAERSVNTICLAISPSLKAKGVKNRCRLADIPPHLHPIIALPRMQLYIDCAAEIHGVFLQFFAPMDIYTYSIDESFIDLTPYLDLYHKSPREIAQEVLNRIREVVGTVSTCGIGSNLFLAKVALDIQAKHSPDFIAQLDEQSFREALWDHEPITDFWQIAGGTAKRLRDHGITTMRGIAVCDEALLYRWFGINAELLRDHAWGKEPTTLADIKGYKAKTKSLSSSQVLMRSYSAAEAEIIAKEMVDQLCLEMAGQHIAAESVSLYIGYSYECGISGSGGTAKFTEPTNLPSVVIPAVGTLYRRIVRSGYPIRTVSLSCNKVCEDLGVMQLSMYEDSEQKVKERALQETMLELRARYGKNVILRGMSYMPASTIRTRNTQIGGHRGQ